MNDGTAAILLMSESKALELGYEPSFYWEDSVTVGVEPVDMGLAPIKAINTLKNRTGVKQSEIDLFEINEAFSTQMLAVIDELKLKQELVNVNGGTLAIGHPLGASGTRIIVSLLNEMEHNTDVKRGCASLCIGGGMGIAAFVKKGTL
ncbi:MAG: hypothetical protein ACK5NF_00885 [Bacilli bacterium]